MGAVDNAIVGMWRPSGNIVIELVAPVSHTARPGGPDGAHERASKTRLRVISAALCELLHTQIFIAVREVGG